MSSQWKLVPVEPTQSILDAMTTERKKGNGVLQMWFEAMAAAPAPPIDAEGVDFGIDGRSVRVSQEAYSIFLARDAAGREKMEALQQRLNAADQRIDGLEGLLREWMQCGTAEASTTAHLTKLREVTRSALANVGDTFTLTPSPSLQRERDMFEEWADEESEIRGVGSTIGLSMDEHSDRYSMIWTQTSWLAWQARAALNHIGDTTEKVAQPFTEQFIEDHLGKMPNLSQGN